jgi:hypothetical protein
MNDLSVEVACKFILILYPPTLGPPFSVKVGIESTITSGVITEGQLQIMNCHSIEDGVENALALLNRLGVKKAENFALVYPLFQGQNETENIKIIDIAWEVKAVADQYNWTFARTIPQ